jgi:NADPH-dependent ferric siderophore reductase
MKNWPSLLVGVEDGHDVRMVQPRGRLGLAQEELEGPGMVAAQPLRQALQGDDAAEPGIAGLVDDAHPAAADLLEQLVADLADEGRRRAVGDPVADALGCRREDVARGAALLAQELDARRDVRVGRLASPEIL